MFRFVLKTGVVLLIVLGLALSVLLFLPAEKIAAIASARFEAATGRAMTLEGDVLPSIWPQLGVKTGRVTIANADWSDDGPILEAEGLAVGVDFRSLISGDIKITEIKAISPRILLEVSQDGSNNWDLSAASSEATPKGGDAASKDEVRTFSLDEAVITDGSLTFLDHRTNVKHQITDVEANVRLPDFSGTAGIELQAQTNGHPISLDAKVDEFANFLSTGAVPVNLVLNIGGSTIDFDGRGGLSPLGVSGALDANLSDMAGVFGALGMERPDVPKGLGQVVGVVGDMTYVDDVLSLRGASVKLDQNRLVGAIDLSLKDKPGLTGKFTTGALDLSNIGSSGGVGPAGKSSGWSRETIDASGLAVIDADVTIEADSVALGPAKLGQTRISATLDDSRAVVNIRELQAYDGAVSGAFVVNGRSGLSVSADLEGRALALKPMLSQLAGYDRLIAAGDMELEVLGVGNSMDAIMRSLNGEGSFTMGAGELFGLDLVGMLKNLDPSFVGKGAKTIFDSISGTFLIQDGVLSNENLSLKSPLLAASGSGKIGLGGQTLDYRLKAKLLDGSDFGFDAPPVLITGTWADPKIRLDLKSLADERINIEKAKIEEKAKAALKDKLEGELNLEAEEGKSAEDILKDKLEDKAKDGLLKLLGR